MCRSTLGAVLAVLSLAPFASAEDDAQSDNQASAVIEEIETSDVRRVSSGAYLRGLDALLAEQQALRLAKKPKALDLTLTFSGRQLPDIRTGGFRVGILDDDQKTDESFFYLRDVSQDTSDPMGVATKPDFSNLVAPSGQLRDTMHQDVMSARIGLALGAGVKSDGSIDPGFLIDLESSYTTNSGTATWADYGGLTDQIVERGYNVGVTLGYSGFNLDARLSREWSPFISERIGYDVGFSYRSNSWSARLAWSAYKAGEDLRGFDNDARQFISFELGANLKLTERLGLSGGIRHYEYGEWRLVPGIKGEDDQMVFLGGRLKF